MPSDLVEAFRVFPRLLELCGQPVSARRHSGLTNNVFALKAEQGDFFIRLPETGRAGTINREAEAHNLGLAAGLGLALAPLFCDVASGILVTRAVAVCDRPAADTAWQVGSALGRLHSSSAGFVDVLSPDEVLRTQRNALVKTPALHAEAEALIGALAETCEPEEASDFVPSHGDPSPGNFLATADRIWLIDWEYSAMADPAWDLAYAILEHDFSRDEENSLLEGYRVAGAVCPHPARIDVMKAKCDAVSACWALEQLAAGREAGIYRPFATARRDRALQTLNRRR